MAHLLCPPVPPVGFPQLLGVLVALVGLPLHYWLLLGRLSFPAALGRVALVGPVLAPLPPPLLPYALLARPDLGSRGWVGANTIRLGISHWLENCLSA